MLLVSFIYMKYCILILINIAFLFSCSSSKLLEQWKDPETQYYDSNKVLVIGITRDTDARNIFEHKLVSKLESNGVNAVKSIDFFEESFTNSKKTEEELDLIEKQLLEAGFDVIILSKVINSEDKLTLVKEYKNINQIFNNFKEDYSQNQDIYYREEHYEETKIYHTETTLYCICIGKERELMWRASIDITNPYKTENTVKDYVDLIVQELKIQNLLIIENKYKAQLP